MNRLSFFKSLFLAPVAFSASGRSEETLVVEPLVKVFKYQTERGRPWLLFLHTKTQKRRWWYWVFDDERNPQLPKEYKQEFNCVGCPPTSREGWHFFEGDATDVRMHPTSIEVPCFRVCEAHELYQAMWDDKKL